MVAYKNHIENKLKLNIKHGIEDIELKGKTSEEKKASSQESSQFTK